MHRCERIIVTRWCTNCYILTSADESFIIDPGGEIEKLAPYMDHLRLKAVILTHGHCDHFGAANEIRQKYSVPVWLHTDDLDMVRDPQLSGFADEQSDYVLEKYDRLLADGDELQLGNDSFSVMHTPGHTPGSICLLDRANKVFFSGDTLFKRNIGSTAFALGDPQKLHESLSKITRLDPALMVFPGHGESTLLQSELLHNPWLQEWAV